eukprot:363398_1
MRRRCRGKRCHVRRNLQLGGTGGLGHVGQEVHNTVGVTPLVVVPADNLEEALLTGQVVLEGGQGIVDGATVIVDEVGGDKLLGGDSEDAAHVGGGGLLEEGVDLLDGGVLGGGDGQVDDGHIRGRDTEGHAGQLALGDGEHLTDGLGGTGGGGDDVAGGGAATTPVLQGGTVDGLLGGGVGVDGGHETRLDAEALLEEDVDHGGQAVGGAGGVAHNVVSGGVVLLVVDAHDDGLDATLGRGGDDDLLGTSLDVALGLALLAEETGGLNDVLDAEAAPGEVGGVALGLDALDVVAVDDNDVVLLHGGGRLGGGDGVLELTVGGVVLDLVGEVVGVDGDIGDGNDVVGGAEETLVAHGLEDHAANAAESVDTNLGGGHCCCLLQ